MCFLGLALCRPVVLCRRLRAAPAGSQGDLGGGMDMVPLAAPASPPGAAVQ
jgi:hypothetical protein